MLNNATTPRIPTLPITVPHPPYTTKPADPIALPQREVDPSRMTAAIEAEAAEVIGRPFPMSPSVEGPCRKEIAKDPKTASCDRVLDLLSAMAREPRDPAWAFEAETRLRDLINANPKLFTIRAIECRTSLCAIEVASTYGQYLGVDGVDKWIDRNLMLSIGLHGLERDSSSTSTSAQ